MSSKSVIVPTLSETNGWQVTARYQTCGYAVEFIGSGASRHDDGLPTVIVGLPSGTAWDCSAWDYAGPPYIKLLPPEEAFYVVAGALRAGWRPKRGRIALDCQDLLASPQAGLYHLIGASMDTSVEQEVVT